MDILSWLDGTQFWHWWILAAIFAGIEILAPGVFFIWLGAAAALTGVTALEVDHDGHVDTVITTDLDMVDRHFGRESLAHIVDLADAVRTHFGGLARVTPLD